MQTLVEVQARIAEIIAEQGEDTKRSCYYTDVYAEHDGQIDDENGELLPGVDLNAVKPHCIVGNILWQDGIRGEDLVACEDKSAIRAISRNLPGAYNSEAVNYLNLLQTWQDAGLTWGQAKQMTDLDIHPNMIHGREWWDRPMYWESEPEVVREYQASQNQDVWR